MCWTYTEDIKNREVEYVAARLHPKTVNELCTLESTRSPLDILDDSIDKSYKSWALKHNNKIFALAGLSEVTKDVSLIWLVTTNDIFDWQYGFIKAMRRFYFPRMVEYMRGDTIGQMIDLRFQESIKLFSSCGLKPTEHIEYLNYVPFVWCQYTKEG